MRRALIILGVLFLLTTLLAAGPVTAQPQAQRGLRVVAGEATDAPRFVTGIEEPARKGNLAELALSHLSSNGSLYEIDAPAADLDVIGVERDDESSTVRFQQLYNGVEVFGAHYLVHFDEQGAGREVTAVNGSFFTDLTTSVEPRISEATAQRLALARQRAIRVERVDTHGLVVLPEGNGVSAFRFTIWGHGPKGPVKQEVFVSARTGSQVLSYNDLHRADPLIGSGETAHGDTEDLSIFQRADGDYELRGFLTPIDEPFAPPVQIVTHNAKGADGLSFKPNSSTVAVSPTDHFTKPHASNGAVDAHWGTEQVFQFYAALGRNSIDDMGGAISSVVNATEFGGPMYNAFWDGKRMVYGNPETNPNTREVYPFSADLDVVAHELTHGVIDHSSELVYLNQSGAMNEAYADYFGNAVDVTVSGTPMDDPEAGHIAEDLCVDQVDPQNWDCPLRDLNDGTTVENFGFYLVDFDNGGVHLNSTIFSGALWDIRQGLENPAPNEPSADQIMYRALTMSDPLSDFVAGREAILLAAEFLEASPEQFDVIDAAFDSRGIVEGWDDVSEPSDALTLIDDVVPLGFFNAAPQVSGSRYVIGNYVDKEEMFEVPQDIVVGDVSDADLPIPVNTITSDNVLFDELPDISGKQVVWARGVGSGNNVTFNVVNRKLGDRMRTIANSSALEWWPSIDGNLVAWESLGSQTDIWARRMGKLPKRMTNSGVHEFYPQVAGNKIAWWDERADRIAIKDFRTGAKTIIRRSNPSAFLGPPALNDTHVFWFQDGDNDGTGAIMRAKHNGKRKTILVGSASANAPFYAGFTIEPPRISANNSFLVYVDERGYFNGQDPDFPRDQVGRDVWQIPVTPLEDEDDPRLVTCNRGDQAYASIGNEKQTVWLDGSLGRTDLMSMSMPDPPVCP